MHNTESTLSNETRAVQLLRRIFSDDDDSLFSRRIGNANQLLKMLEESRSTISDSLEFRQEQKQLLDICVYDEGLRRIVEFPKAPPTLKNTMLKIVSGLACYTRLDLALSWIFDRLSVWDTSVNDREWKKWLLKLLKQASEDKSIKKKSSVVMLDSIDFDGFGYRSVYIQANFGNVARDFSQPYFLSGYHGFIRLPFDCSGNSRVFFRKLSKHIWAEIQCNLDVR